MPQKINADALVLEPGAMVELYDLDLSIVGGPLLSFQPQPCVTLVFGGVSYVAAPVEATGFDRTTKGTAPRPVFRVGNINSAITAYLQSVGDIAGARFTRTRTFAKYLDAASGAFATQPDPTAYFPKEIWYIERKSAETNQVVEFELSMSADVEGTMLPRRVVLANACPWAFRGGECGWTGSAPGTIFYDYGLTARTVGADRGAISMGTSYALNDGGYVLTNGIRRYFISLQNGNLGNVPNYAANTAWWAPDTCSKRVTDCKLRFQQAGQSQILPFGGFPGTAKLPRV